MRRTFLDSGVYLTAWRGRQADAELALDFMLDPARDFFTCQMVKLELFPKAHFNKRPGELEFYEPHFALVKHDEPLSKKLSEEAMGLGKKYGLGSADAINVAAALRMKVEDFITSEAPNIPMFRVPGMRFISLVG